MVAPESNQESLLESSSLEIQPSVVVVGDDDYGGGEVLHIGEDDSTSPPLENDKNENNLSATEYDGYSDDNGLETSRSTTVTVPDELIVFANEMLRLLRNGTIERTNEDNFYRGNINTLRHDAGRATVTISYYDAIRDALDITTSSASSHSCDIKKMSRVSEFNDMLEFVERCHALNYTFTGSASGVILEGVYRGAHTPEILEALRSVYVEYGYVRGVARVIFGIINRIVSMRFEKV